MTNVEMPKANENLTEATLDRWLVKEGDYVKQDQGLCEIITDKAKFDMPAPVAGTVIKILAPERSVLPVGYVMCAIGVPGESGFEAIMAANESVLDAHRSAMTGMSAASSSGLKQTTGSAPLTEAVRATPAARRMAKDAGVELAEIARTLKLTAPINEKDVKAFLAQK